MDYDPNRPNGWRKTRTTNASCRPLVDSRTPFQGSNMYAEWRGKCYVVFSYGSHFPMYIYDPEAGIWFGNRDKYSTSTTRQQSQARPSEPIGQWLDTVDMRAVAMFGFADLIARRMEGENRTTKLERLLDKLIESNQVTA